MALAALEVLLCAIEGTVSCAKRDEGRVLRTGVCNADGVVSTGAAAAGATGAALGAVRTAVFTGTSAAAALAALAVTLVVALDLLGSAFNSCLLTVHASLPQRPGRASRRVGGKPLC